MRNVIGLTLLAAAVIAGAWWLAAVPGFVEACHSPRLSNA